MEEALRKQFSLDYPSETISSPKEDFGSRALDEAVIVYSEPIIRSLDAAPNKEMRAHDLIRKVNEEKSVPSYESFIEVINHLANLKFVDIADRDITGNYLIRLLRKP